MYVSVLVSLHASTNAAIESFLPSCRRRWMDVCVQFTGRRRRWGNLIQIQFRRKWWWRRYICCIQFVFPCLIPCLIAHICWGIIPWITSARMYYYTPCEQCNNAIATLKRDHMAKKYDSCTACITSSLLFFIVLSSPNNTMNLIMAYLVLRFCSTKGFPRHLFSSMAIMTALVVMSNTTATTPPTIAIVSLTVMNGAETKTANTINQHWSGYLWQWEWCLRI